MTSRKQKVNRKWVRAVKRQPLPLHNQHLPMSLHLLKVPQPSKTAAPTGDGVFKHMWQWGTFHIQATEKALRLHVWEKGRYYARESAKTALPISRVRQEGEMES